MDFGTAGYPVSLLGCQNGPGSGGRGQKPPRPMAEEGERIRGSQYNGTGKQIKLPHNPNMAVLGRFQSLGMLDWLAGHYFSRPSHILDNSST
ncbi:hypothetical protein COLO4_06077 [Corchorus olitorius]|uniref:Uncharacterized protein n=1 Tax=Corchorus olitorius TaxID=93759 RepID=A0A1R3KP02_9ROSI|nr:hypothetical protein COLO4_06077 [Corchorus olitorius]